MINRMFYVIFGIKSFNRFIGRILFIQRMMSIGWVKMYHNIS